MTDFIGGIESIGLQGIGILIKPKRGFFNITNSDGTAMQDIIAQATVQEMHTDNLELTDHPVALGANITDHAFKLPMELELKLAWSNSPNISAGISQILGSSASAAGQVLGGNYIGAANTAVASSGLSLLAGGFSLQDGSSVGQVNSIYNQLLRMQGNRALFDIFTGKRQYSNMIIKSLIVLNDHQTENSLFVTMHCREIILVSTKTTSIPMSLLTPSQRGIASIVDQGTKAPK